MTAEGSRSVTSEEFVREGIDRLMLIAEQWKSRALVAEPKATLFDEMLDALREHQKFGGLDDLIQRAESLTGKEPAE